MYRLYVSIHSSLFVVLKQLKMPKCFWRIEWLNKMRYIHFVEYYLVIQRNEAWIDLTTWMNLENMPSKEANGKEHYGILLMWKALNN